MKILKDNLISDVSASSEQENTQAISVLSENSTDRWFPDSADSAPYLNLTIGPSANSLLIYKISAASVRVRIYLIGGTTIHDETYSMAITSEWDDDYKDRLLVSYTQQVTTHYAQIFLSGSVSPMAVGICFAACCKQDFTDPKYGAITFAPVDHSKMLDLGGGLKHGIKKNIQETMSFEIVFRDEAESEAFMRVMKKLGMTTPFGFLAHTLKPEATEFISYCVIKDFPNRVPVKYLETKTSFAVEEKL